MRKFFDNHLLPLLCGGCGAWLLALTTIPACQPTNSPRPEPAPSFAVDRVEVRGNCSATLELDIRAGFVAVPVTAVLSTSTVGAHTRGGASVDVGGLVTARCDIDTNEPKECAQGGLLLRGVQPDQDATNPAD